ncbi:hypothetical protein DFH06DRAFT_453167 [Mycena polygramma]|nr:hypothetical protein DFH06DRAFT_453167 [Mycena polygramma]
MDAALHIDSMGALPPSIQLPPWSLNFNCQEIAIAAAQGDTRAAHRLDSILQGVSDAQKKTLVALLPVFYANLDPIKIPRDDELDALSTSEQDILRRAFLALRAVSIHLLSFLPPAALPDLWPRAWKWIQFFDTRRDDFYVEDVLGLRFLSLACMYIQSGLLDLLSSTTGFFYMLARAWTTVLVDNQDSKTVPVAMDYLIFCITGMSKNLSANLVHAEELIEGAGGDLLDLAQLVVIYITKSSSSRSSRSTDDDPAFAGSILDVVEDIDNALGNRNAKLGLFSSALLRVGVMNALTFMVGSTTRPGSGFSEMEGTTSLLVLEKSYRFMIMTLYTVPGRCYTVEAIRGGLLRVIVLTAAAGKLMGNLKFIFEKMLPNSLLYYYDLRVLNLALQDLETYGYTRDPKFIASPAFDAWTEFETLAEERLTIFRRLATGDSPRLRGCDNAKCCRIADASLFKRCSGCRFSHYCSAECQHIDWRQGQHRKYCDAQSRLRLGSMRSSAIGAQPCTASYWSARWARERAFLRALLTHDYHTMKYSHIFHTQVMFMAESPECTMFLTMFDYTKGPRVRLEIQCVEHGTVPRYVGDDPLWLNALLRASESGGRITLHVMVIPNGGGDRLFVVPLRTETSQVHDTLTEIATRFGDGCIPKSDLGREIFQAMESLGPELAVHC